jgi:hypothetical protein
MGETSEELANSRDEYESLMNRLGYGLEDLAGQQQRGYPRLRFDSPEKTILIQIGGYDCVLVDISLGGLSFYAPRDLGVDSELALNFDGRFDVKGRVMRVVVDESLSTDTKRFFFHAALFQDEIESYRCTLLVLEYLASIIRG